MLSSRKKRGTVVALALMLVLSFSLVFSGCSKAEEPKKAADKPVENINLVLASTTSTQDSGLFDVLIPEFEKANPGIKVQVVAVGSGEAIQKGRDGDADVLLVHSPADEQKFVDEGFAANGREAVMHNSFVVVGPENDPAKVKGSKTAAEAFKKIADAKAPFASRADESGTHKKELKLWDAAKVEPKGDWYKTTGQGMGETLKVADETNAYTLSDTATFFTMEKEGAVASKILVEESEDLLNPYSVIVVADAKQLDAANKFASWIISAEGQKVVAEYGVADFGKPLFTPDAKK